MIEFFASPCRNFSVEFHGIQKTIFQTIKQTRFSLCNLKIKVRLIFTYLLLFSMWDKLDTIAKACLVLSVTNQQLFSQKWRCFGTFNAWVVSRFKDRLSGKEAHCWQSFPMDSFVKVCLRIFLEVTQQGPWKEESWKHWEN